MLFGEVSLRVLFFRIRIATKLGELRFAGRTLHKVLLLIVSIQVVLEVIVRVLKPTCVWVLLLVVILLNVLLVKGGSEFGDVADLIKLEQASPEFLGLRNRVGQVLAALSQHKHILVLLRMPEGVTVDLAESRNPKVILLILKVNVAALALKGNLSSHDEHISLWSLGSQRNLTVNNLILHHFIFSRLKL